jgi:hypothetical protein
MYRTEAVARPVQRKVRSLNRNQNHVRSALFCNTGYHTIQYASWKLSPLWNSSLLIYGGQQKLVSICTRYTQTHRKNAVHYDFWG